MTNNNDYNLKYNLFVLSNYRSSNANEKLANSDSAENINPIENGAATSSSPRIRNRYLKRIGVGGDDIEDELPLLDDN